MRFEKWSEGRAEKIVIDFLNLRAHTEFTHVTVKYERACEICKLRNRARRYLKATRTRRGKP